MQKKFEKMMKKKDDQRLKEVRDPRKKFEQDMEDTKRCMLELLGASGGPTTNVGSIQPSRWSLEVGPTANSTGNPLPQISVHDVSQGEDILAQELKLLEERQALERKHLEERNRLLQRRATIDGGAGRAGLNPRATMFQPSGSSFFDAPTLNQSQIKARQAVNRELPSFSGNPEA